ncbi:15.0 kDa [Spodoptera frugiperda ascovirus 1a]|uniref:15.0 kDa n=1 Tax=Spodoptera frugiperda ascovirus 1a TaxID=113370 RepID=Q9DKN1_SFAVA|nr:15.0 kDa [Spodoptera frugiperda ascovirus 1a]CAC19162.1 hypothetical protein [Spodoptera frugiperda ascovirus 1a]CAL44721.1 15.0 kDa [Spodoptera frugiperda ascovirus 1a]
MNRVGIKFVFVVSLVVVLDIFGDRCEAVCCKRTRIVWTNPEQGCGKYPREFYVNSSWWRIQRMPDGCVAHVCNDRANRTACSTVGVGKCNIFGCNCDARAVSAGDGDALENFKRISGVQNAAGPLFNYKDPTTWG